ncbi:type-F conjugative transfer system secretin TraK [Edwardsiella tarda]|uniref:Type-F conjugative transfer system secretin TraK n=1 Tax=Edwardsiella tarda TaxID=636 RepID=A0A2A7U829_EDWTA|nr:type-F conjugative transfer system secretin TraK [Edwardsiella tarda]PEH74459.1 type-F conjugative transfer system secretin TraK [Edwardsiella tarda]
MKINKPLLLVSALLLASYSQAGIRAATAPTLVPLSNGGQANIALSNTDPNLFTVAGDRITAINSLEGELTRQEQTASGGVVVATLNKKPFTFIIETERGLNFSIRAVPRAGEGRTIQLVSDLLGTGEAARAWEESSPYEALLVAVNKGVHEGTLPAGWNAIPVTNETLAAPAGLQTVADKVWIGHHLKVVRYTVINQGTTSKNVSERDFWQPGTRAIMFVGPAQQIIGGGRMQVYVTTSGEER